MAAIPATFADFKLIKGRKVAQFVLEVPIEQANAALAALGGVPRSDEPQWVGVAPLTSEAAQKPAEKPKGGKLAQRAGILCGNESFWRFLTERRGYQVINADGAARYLRAHCNVDSRADLDHNEGAAQRFQDVARDFFAWRAS